MSNNPDACPDDAILSADLFEKYLYGLHREIDLMNLACHWTSLFRSPLQRTPEPSVSRWLSSGWLPSPPPSPLPAALAEQVAL
jgi:hypothetical protein